MLLSAQFVAVEGWFAAARPPQLPRRRGTWEQPQPSSSRLIVRRGAPRMTLEDSHAKLVLVRHGQSEWNRANLFTGWVDVDLTEKGINEARKAGKLLQVEGFLFDKCYTSYLRRAIRSSCLMLSSMDQCWVPLNKSPLLNEQHSGELCGQNKRHLAEEYGVDQVMAWRREYASAPGPLQDDSPLQQALFADARYRDFFVPAVECLADTQARTQELWDTELAPALQAGRNVLVVSHGNTLRALVKLLDGVSDADVFHVDLPTAVPLVYSLDEQLQPTETYGFWGWASDGSSASDAARGGRFLVDEAKVKKAQLAMRQQVLEDVQYSTYAGPGTDWGGDAVRPAFLAAAPSYETVVEDDGMEYAVRSRPPTYYSKKETAEAAPTTPATGVAPTYFAQESERLQTQAEVEYAALMKRNGKAIPGHKKKVKAALVLLRHGHSVWNEKQLFTGWADVELTNRGREEARLAGRMIRQIGLQSITHVYASVLKRAIKTAWLMLDELELGWTPLTYTWRLNERHYGALQGEDKKECVQRYGLKQVQSWRRGWDDRPPSVGRASDHSIDRRYDMFEARNGVPGHPVPDGESLKECTERMLPFLNEDLYPSINEAIAKAEATAASTGAEYEPPTFVVCSSDNLIRAMVKELEGLTASEVPLIDVPYATPLVYQLDGDLAPLATPWAHAPMRCGWYLGDPDRVAEVVGEIQADLTGCDTSVGESIGDDDCAVPEDEEVCYVPPDDVSLMGEWKCE
jgi:2,3-bisphosphoglycerate-dependent phosphoglycerate mutase